MRAGMEFFLVLDPGIDHVFEHRIIRYDTGDIRWLSWVLRREKSDFGRPSSVYGTVRDITESRANERAVRALQLRAQRRIRQLDRLSEQLSEEQRKTAKALAIRNEFLSEMAHEIRTPLTAIMGLSDMLSSRLKDDHNKDIAQTIVRSSETLDRILTDTLDYASLEAGKLSFRSEAADLTEMAEDLRRLWSAEASRRSLSFRVGFVPDGPHCVETDLGRVRQIANNLISNALKFTRDGEVSATLTTQSVGQALMLKLSVTDTGRGLTDAQRQRFMDVFEKGPAPHGAKGWGLGLTISRALAMALGGQLTYADNPAGGSVFTLSIPVSAVAKEQSDPIAMPRRGKFQLGDILLVEDHEASAMVVINALEQAGWTVHHAGTLYAAESYIALTAFQAVLTDLHLPDGNALGFIDGVRSRSGPNADVPIIALTADISQGRLQSCLANGADRALKKPIAGPELVATIADVLMSRASNPPSPVELRGRLAS